MVGVGGALDAEALPQKFYYEQGRKLLEAVVKALVQFFKHVGKI